MALLVETGLGVSGANSFASDTYVRAYCSARGLALPESDSELEKNILLAMDHINALEYSDTQTFIGVRVDPQQTLAFPRSKMVLSSGAELSETTVPLMLQDALAQLTADCFEAGGILTPNTTGQAITEETIGPITTKYATPIQGGSSGESINFSKFEQIMKPLLTAATGTGQVFSTRRV